MKFHKAMLTIPRSLSVEGTPYRRENFDDFCEGKTFDGLGLHSDWDLLTFSLQHAVELVPALVLRMIQRNRPYLCCGWWCDGRYTVQTETWAQQLLKPGIWSKPSEPKPKPSGKLRGWLQRLTRLTFVSLIGSKEHPRAQAHCKAPVVVHVRSPQSW